MPPATSPPAPHPLRQSPAQRPDDYFDRLGRLVDARWAAAGGRHPQLAEIAAAALEEVPVPEALDAMSVLGRLTRDDGLPAQHPVSDAFGQPPAVMYKSPVLEIQALTWMEGSTQIHQHGFDGAFRVLQGSSLHVEYSFDEAERLADGHLVTGALRMGASEVLRPGAVRAIPSGPDFIHGLFHLERPSVTIVVRNWWSDLPFPQYAYRQPGIGIDVLERDERLGMRLRGLQAMHSLAPGEAVALADDVVRHEDLWTAFRVTDYWFQRMPEATGFSDLAATLGGRDATLGEVIEPMYGEERRQSRLLMRRGLLTEQRHRLLLAVLVNLPDPGAITAALGQLFPGEDPAAVTLALVEEMASPQYRGVSGLNLRAEQLAHVRATLGQGLLTEGLALLGAQWRPPTWDAIGG